MICFVDMEHPSALSDPSQRAIHDDFCRHVQHKLADVAGAPCEVRRYTDLTPRWLDESGVRALVISGNATDWPAYSSEEMAEIMAIIRGGMRPILAICGGIQLIAMAYDVPLDPIQRLAPGEPDPAPQYVPGFSKEWGFLPVKVTRADPLFESLGDNPVFLAAHYLNIARLPPGFVSLAETAACPHQAIRHERGPVYGVQFHPEAYIDGPEDADNWLIDLVYPDGYTTPHPDGRTVLANFCALAGFT